MAEEINEFNYYKYEKEIAKLKEIKKNKDEAITKQLEITNALIGKVQNCSNLLNKNAKQLKTMNNIEIPEELKISFNKRETADNFVNGIDMACSLLNTELPMFEEKTFNPGSFLSWVKQKTDYYDSFCKHHTSLLENVDKICQAENNVVNSNVINNTTAQQETFNADNSPIAQEETINAYNSPIAQEETINADNRPIAQEETINADNSPTAQEETFNVNITHISPKEVSASTPLQNLKFFSD